MNPQNIFVHFIILASIFNTKETVSVNEAFQASLLLPDGSYNFTDILIELMESDLINIDEEENKLELTEFGKQVLSTKIENFNVFQPILDTLTSVKV